MYPARFLLYRSYVGDRFQIHALFRGQHYFSAFAAGSVNFCKSDAILGENDVFREFNLPRSQNSIQAVTGKQQKIIADDIFYFSVCFFDKMWYNICGRVILLIDILVCDDSAEIVEQVKKLLCAWEKVNTVSFNIDCRQSGKFILENKHKYDIAFIDIEMPEMSGLELAVELKKQNPDVLIIVLISFQRYLDDAMRIHVFRYLSKPVDVNRFNKNLFDAVQEYRTLSKTIILETHDIVKKIKTKDILYIENRRYGALLVTKDAEYATGVRLKDWIAKTGQPDCFVYSHASYIVNLQNVIDFSKDSVTLRKGDGETVSVYMSQRKYPAFRKAFFNFAGGI